MGVRELRMEIIKNCDILQAVLAFNYCLNKQNKSKLDNIRILSLGETAKGLRDIRDSLRENLKKITREFGCLIDPASLAGTVLVACRSGVPSFSKAAIDSQLFSNFCNGHPTWKAFPPHLRLQVHFDWIVNDPIIFHYQLPEAMLYEDMALAYNFAHDSLATVNGKAKLEADLNVKRNDFYSRTALLSAFYFVEAYLNGVAYDFYYKNKGHLSSQDQDLLLEWDSQRNRRWLVSLERKINEYPKIILKCQHPPLTVTNSKNLNILLGDAKDMRDSVVHQSSKEIDIGKVPDKVKAFLGIRFGKVTPIVDAAVGFVKEMNDCLGSHGLLLEWLHPRQPESGKFPPEAFA